MKREPWISLCVAVLVAPVLLGQPNPPVHRTISATVIDKAGTAVMGLTAANFRGEFRGKPIRFLSAELDPEPCRILVMLDLSTGMRAPAKWSVAWFVAERVIRHLGATHSMALMTLGEQTTHWGEFRRNPELLVQELVAVYGQEKDKRAVGGSLVVKNLLNALDEFPSLEVGDVVYLISDFMDMDEAHRRDRRLIEAKRALAGKGIRVFTAWLNDPILDSPGNLSRARYGDSNILRLQLAEASGGRALEIRVPVGKPEEVTGHLDTFNASLATTYRLELELAREVDKPREWKLEVVGEDGKEMKDLQVAYPRLLLPRKDSGPDQ